jgi:predicted Rossmann-fold nucleotide-binding protein
MCATAQSCTPPRTQHARTRVIIGLMGGNLQHLEARDIGSSVAHLNHILLTGAPIGDMLSREIHRAAMHAASLIAEARLIGILPRGTPGPGLGVRGRGADDKASDVDRRFEMIQGIKGFYFQTGLASEERDSVTGLTPDVLIFLRGSTGTLCELAYAAASRRRTYFVDSVEFLREKLRVGGSAGKIDQTFAKAQRHCGQVGGQEISVSEMKQCVAERLATAEDWKGELSDLVAEAANGVTAETLKAETGFPICFGCAEKREFERRVLELE